MMGIREGRKITSNMGGLLQDRYRATMDHSRRSLPGLEFVERGDFRYSIVNIRIVVTILLYVFCSLFLFFSLCCAKEDS